MITKNKLIITTKNSQSKNNKPIKNLYNSIIEK